jgi:hypothetical protein
MDSRVVADELMSRHPLNGPQNKQRRVRVEARNSLDVAL